MKGMSELGDRSEPSAEGSLPVRCRAASVADLEALVHLETNAFDAPWTAEQIAQFWSVPGGRGWLAEDAEGRAVGFALFREVHGEAELLRVATHPAWQRRQVAKSVLGEALAALDGAGVDCFLEVRADNLAAQELYARLGFELSGRRRKYYRDGCDARLYARRAPR